ncbi:alpha/beta fold hydrolase [Bradyrhizobium sp.]|uniref:alpha/beta fold hydrolase n=1 Tax=Bradyrhizobium sp. TaxID=376 RepID=UPI0039E26FC2
MTAFHFGNRERRLFGYYEPAQSDSARVQAALLCHPMGNEQVFAYRTMRQLATRLVRAGFHVLRFDYFGTGDSYGDASEGDIGGWCGDIETAIEELKEVSGAAKVNVVGLRLGANLSAQAALHQPHEIDRLVLWEPLEAGDLAAVTREYPAHQASVDGRANGSIVIEDYARGTISGNAARLPRRTLLLLTEQPPSPIESGSLTAEYVLDAPAWIEERLTTGSIPAGALQRIVDWLQ